MPVQVPTLDPKLTDRHYWIDSCRSFAHASFLRQNEAIAAVEKARTPGFLFQFFFQSRKTKSGTETLGWRLESYILLENGPIQSVIAWALQHSSLAVRRFHTAREGRCGWGYDQCVQTLLPDGSGSWNSSKQSMWAQMSRTHRKDVLRTSKGISVVFVVGILRLSTTCFTGKHPATRSMVGSLFNISACPATGVQLSIYAW